MTKKKIALILADYKNTFQPYLSRWAQSLPDKNTIIDYFSFSKTINPSRIDIKIIGEKSRFKKAVNFIAFSFEFEQAFLRFFLDAKNKTYTRKKINLWSQFGILIANEYKFVHIANSYLFPKLLPLLETISAPLIITFRGQDTYIRPFVSPDWEHWLAIIYEKAAYLHYVSEAMKNFAVEHGAPEQKCIVIHPGIDIDFYHRKAVIGTVKEKNKIFLATVGRLVWEKDYITALQATRLLIDDGFNIHYNVIGSGNELAQIDFWIRKLFLQKNVTIWGALPSEKVRELLWISDLYIQPSLSESFGVSVVEAQAMQLPVVCANVGGLPEIVEDGVTGLLIPPSDPHALAKAIARLCVDSSMRKSMGQAGRNRVEEKFSLETEIKKWRALYQTG